MERIAPGAFADTIAERGDRIKVLFDHGQDPTLGNKPLGTIESLSEDAIGAAYEVRLIDTPYNRDFIIPAARANLLGASFRFRVTAEEWDNEPTASRSNPAKLPERTITGAEVFEFGPVTFPAYDAASAAVRCGTDRFIDSLTNDPRFVARMIERVGVNTVEQIIAGLPARTTEAAADGPTPTADADTTEDSDDVQQRCDQEPAPMDGGPPLPRKTSERPRLHDRPDAGAQAPHRGLGKADTLTDDQRTEWTGLTTEWDILEDQARRPRGAAGPRPQASSTSFNINTSPDPFKANLKELSRANVIGAAKTAVEEVQRSFAHPDHAENVTRLIERGDGVGELAARLALTTGTPEYRDEWLKKMTGQSHDQRVLQRATDEYRAMTAGTSTSGGAFTPLFLDPTMVITGAGSYNPFRRVANIKTINTLVYNGGSAAQVTAGILGENVAFSDNAPTTAAKAITTYKYGAYIPAASRPSRTSTLWRRTFSSSSGRQGQQRGDADGDGQWFGPSGHRHRCRCHHR